MKAGQVIVKPQKSSILNREDRPFYRLRTLDHGVFPVRIAAGVAVWLIRQYLFPHNGQILLINLPDGGRRLRLGAFLGCDGLHIPHHLPDERIIVQFFRVRHLAVHDPALGQGLPDGDRVDVVKTVLFFLGIEAVLLDELGDPALYFGPRHIARRAIRCDGKGRQRIAVFLPQPGGGVLFTGMVLHVADNRVLALDVAVPFLDGGINVGLGKRPVRGRRCWRGRFRLRDSRRARRENAWPFINPPYLFLFRGEQG